MKKTAILVIGEYDSGKTSIIRALTGITGKNYLWQVRTISRRRIWAFVIISALQENPEIKHIDPKQKDIVKVLERHYSVTPDSYKLLICPLEIRVSRKLFFFDDYASALLSKGFNVRIACIKKRWDGDNSDITDVQEFATANKIPIEILDVSNSDEHSEARKIRDSLYPN